MMCMGLLILGCMVSCSKLWERGECRVELSFSKDFNQVLVSMLTKGESVTLPDTNDFILSMREEESGKEFFRDTYRNKPEIISLPEGRYIIGVYSSEFNEPSFGTPQFGDEQVINVGRDDIKVSFVCTQLNSGLKLSFDEKFKNHFSSSYLSVMQKGYYLDYPYNEERIAYFDEGNVSILLMTDGKSRQLLSRSLSSNEILTIHFSIDLTSDSDADFKIAVDTGRVWISENYIYGKERDGSTRSRALTTLDVPNHVGVSNLWVTGYIVGGDLSSAGAATYSPPFTSKTHIMISNRPSVTSRDKCVAVELKAGALRDALNLVDHPQLLGKLIYIKGRVEESYFGLPGVKSVSEFSF